MLVRASKALWKSCFAQPSWAAELSSEMKAGPVPGLAETSKAALHTVANTSVNETPVQKLVALPQVLKDQANIPAGTIKGCLDNATP